MAMAAHDGLFTLSRFLQGLLVCRTTCLVKARTVSSYIGSTWHYGLNYVTMTIFVRKEGSKMFRECEEGHVDQANSNRLLTPL
jgi:hypothetical protein